MNPPCSNQSRMAAREPSQNPTGTKARDGNMGEKGKNAELYSWMQQGESTTPCADILTHPWHTLSVSSLCQSCQEDRDMRIGLAERPVRQDMARRISARTIERNERGFSHGRRIYRSSTMLPMKLESSAKLNMRKERVAATNDRGKTGDSNAARQRMGDMGAGVRSWLAQDAALAQSPGMECGQSFEAPAPSPSSSGLAARHASTLTPSPSPLTRLSFAALAGTSTSSAMETW